MAVNLKTGLPSTTEELAETRHQPGSVDWTSDSVIAEMEERNPEIFAQHARLATLHKMADQHNKDYTEETTSSLPISFIDTLKVGTDGLSMQEKLFVLQYAVSMNPVEACKAAGLDSKTKHTTVATATRILKKPVVARALDRLLEHRMIRMGINHESILSGIMDIARANLGDVIEWDEEGKVVMKDIEEVPDYAKAAISEIKQTVAPNGTVTTSVKLHDKLKALELLAKITKLLSNQHVVKIDDDQNRASALEEGRKRALKAASSVIEGEVVNVTYE